MYFVESGSVNITLTDSDATEREVSVCKAGSYLGKSYLQNTLFSAQAGGSYFLRYLRQKCSEKLEVLIFIDTKR